jgi:hypothetical protein
MKKLIFILMLFSSSAFADRWRTEDTYREAAYLTLLTIDYLQTREIAKNPGTYYEQNPILGVHPSELAVNRYFVLSSLIHLGLSRTLPHEWRAGFQYVTIARETYAVTRNHIVVGIRIPF